MNIEEKRKKRRQFAAIYGTTIVLIVLVCTAFLLPPQVPARQVVQRVQVNTNNGAGDLILLSEQWTRLQLAMGAYNSALSLGKNENELSDFRLKVEEQKTAFIKIADSLEQSKSPASGFAKLVEVYRTALEIPLQEAVIVNEKASNKDDRTAILQQQVQAKEAQIARLRQNLAAKVTSSAPTVKKSDNEGSEDAKNAKFLSWALSSQSNELAKLRKENAELKDAVSNLKKKQ